MGQIYIFAPKLQHVSPWLPGFVRRNFPHICLPLEGRLEGKTRKAKMGKFELKLLSIFFSSSASALYKEREREKGKETERDFP